MEFRVSSLGFWCLGFKLFRASGLGAWGSGSKLRLPHGTPWHPEPATQHALPGRILRKSRSKSG